MAISNPNAKKGRRFDSYKTAKRFSDTVSGEILDLRNNPIRKSNFKVVYTKISAIKGFNKIGDSIYPDSYFK